MRPIGSVLLLGSFAFACGPDSTGSTVDTATETASTEDSGATDTETAGTTAGTTGSTDPTGSTGSTESTDPTSASATTDPSISESDTCENGSLHFGPVALPPAMEGAAYSVSLLDYAEEGWIGASYGGTPPFGFELDEETLVLSGTPIVTGLFNFTVEAYHEVVDGCSTMPDPHDFTIEVLPDVGETDPGTETDTDPGTETDTTDTE